MFDIIFHVVDPEFYYKPIQRTKDSIGFDLVSREKLIIKPKEHKLIPLNVIIKVRKGLIPLLLPRSSLFKRHNLIVVNSPGLIDWDYCGKDDELMLSVYNMGEETTIVSKGERIAQLILVQTISDLSVNYKSKEDIIDEESRGGFGSTGNML